MKGLAPLFLGIFGTFAFSWAGLTMIPNAQIGHLDPQVDEDGNDPYPAPKSGMADRGRRIYVANGCVYCHSQQVRPDYAASDIDRKWGDRRSAPRDYLFEKPSLLGKMRMGPDLANMGKRAPADDAAAPAPDSTSSTTAAAALAASAAAPSPGAAASPAPAVAAPTAPGPAANLDVPLQYSAAWHHQHLYNPRSIAHNSTMPAYRFLYQTREISGQRAADALKFSAAAGSQEGWEVVPTYDAKCLVAYLMSLDQSHALKEVKASAPASPPAPGKVVK